MKLIERDPRTKIIIHDPDRIRVEEIILKKPPLVKESESESEGNGDDGPPNLKFTPPGYDSLTNLAPD